MATTKEQISKWFDNAKSEGWDFLFIVCDTFSYEDYPVGVKIQEYETKYKEFHDRNMQKIMEVYDLSLNKESQINEHRAFHHPDGRKIM